jgi:hypothetical protein
MDYLLAKTAGKIFGQRGSAATGMAFSFAATCAPKQMTKCCHARCRASHGALRLIPEEGASPPNG